MLLGRELGVMSVAMGHLGLAYGLSGPWAGMLSVLSGG
jgi:hypothetical protein